MHNLKTQLHVGHNELQEIDPVKNESFIKPLGGFWTSSLTSVNGAYESAWTEWCDGENFEMENRHLALLLNPNPDAKIYTIDSLLDLTWLMNRYKDPEAKYTHTLDFEKLSEVYDALHLTWNGRAETHLSYPFHLYGWDVESTLWFRQKFTVVSSIERFTITNKSTTTK